MDYDVVVIGAGNGGLTAACSLAQRGVKTLLLERHNVPGGCATSFCRGRFEFEVALHQLSGLGPAEKPGPLRHTLSKLGVVDQLEWVEMDNLYRLLVRDDLDITLKADREAAIQTLQERFPAEKDNITAYFDLVYQFCIELITIYSSRDPEATPEKYPAYFEYALMDTQKVLDKFFTDPLLKLAVSIYWGYTGLPPAKQPFSDMAMLLFSYLELKPYHLKGGSQALSAAILEKFLQSGGEVRFNCGASKILVEDGRVTGVVTEHGETISTSYIISNASTISVYTEMIEPEHVPAEQLKKLGGSTIGPSSITLYIGLDCEPQEIGINETTNFLCASTDMEDAFTACWEIESHNDYTLVSCYNISDPDISPPGTSQVCIVDLKYGESWLNIPPHQYFELKEKVAGQILDRVEHYFPGFREHIEEIEVATPITHMRFLGTPGGAIYGFDQYAKDNNMFTPPRALIKGLYFAGAWAGMGGFQPTLTSGTTAARQVLKDIKRQAGVEI
ncbi:MAG: NAD(P)/FAD-dependent oxidoreductase [Syntrophomonadaceae bacterium]|nr:NAD(P)/FAD-dependent oxidoreductase [Syntrophomonadaceae bacterium]